MKTTELRIGNIVEHNGAIIAVPLGLIQSAERLNPVPITEERLLEFGFLKSSNKIFDNFHLLDKSGLRIMFSVQHWHNVETNGNLLNHWNAYGMLNQNKLQYVHQLQNLYHAFTGEEL